MRMFDRTGWDKDTMKEILVTEVPRRSELCAHVWSREGEEAHLELPRYLPTRFVEGIGYKCVNCSAYLVLP